MGGAGGELDAETVAELTRRDKIMLLRVLERSDAADFQLSELRGWFIANIARVLADPKTPKRLRLRAAALGFSRTDPVPRELTAPILNVDKAVIVLNGNAGAALPSNGVALHLDSGDGNDEHSAGA